MAWINIWRDLRVSHLYRGRSFSIVVYHNEYLCITAVTCITVSHYHTIIDRILGPVIYITLDEWIACLSINNCADIAILVNQPRHHFNLGGGGER